MDHLMKKPFVVPLTSAVLGVLGFLKGCNYASASVNNLPVEHCCVLVVKNPPADAGVEK